jgi:hypothetical protein
VALIRLTNPQATTKSTTQPPNDLKEKEMSQVKMANNDFETRDDQKTPFLSDHSVALL